MSDTNTTDTKIYTAVFAKVRDAKAFAERIGGKGWYAERVRQTSRQVEWVGPATPEYFLDMLETVGYFGSAPTGRKATLNGTIAPASY